MTKRPETETDYVGIGGPTFFLQAPDSEIWGEFELPEGKRIENGDSFNIYDCRFLGVLYRELSLPERPRSGETPSDEYMAASKVWREALKRDDTRISYSASGKFVTLTPLTETNDQTT